LPGPGRHREGRRSHVPDLRVSASTLSWDDDGVRAGEHQARAPVVEPHQVRRAAVGSADLDDLALAVRAADCVAAYQETIPHSGQHATLPTSARVPTVAFHIRTARARRKGGCPM